MLPSGNAVSKFHCGGSDPGSPASAFLVAPSAIWRLLGLEPLRIISHQRISFVHERRIREVVPLMELSKSGAVTQTQGDPRAHGVYFCFPGIWPGQGLSQPPAEEARGVVRNGDGERCLWGCQ